MQLSIVIPVFNEEENIDRLHGAIDAVASTLGLDYEVIYVDDGSSDGSLGLLRAVAGRDGRVRVIRLGRNYGQTAALAAGIEHATGETIVTLDADLQNDPKDIPRLLEKLAEGNDIVSGWRKIRRDPLHRRIPSLLANRLISRITGVRLHDYGCMLKAYRADALSNLRLYGDMHRFIPAYAARDGARCTEIEVAHHPRVAGRSKYGLGRTFIVLLDLLLVRFLSGYGTKPIHLFGGIGLLACFIGIVAGAVTLYEKYAMDVFVHRNPLILLAVFMFLLGIQFILMGLLAEIEMRTYHESQSKPPYTISEVIGTDGGTNE